MMMMMMILHVLLHYLAACRGSIQLLWNARCLQFNEEGHHDVVDGNDDVVVVVVVDDDDVKQFI